MITAPRPVLKPLFSLHTFLALFLFLFLFLFFFFFSSAFLFLLYPCIKTLTLQ